MFLFFNTFFRRFITETPCRAFCIVYSLGYTVGPISSFILYLKQSLSQLHNFTYKYTGKEDVIGLLLGALVSLRGLRSMVVSRFQRPDVP